MFSVVHDLCHSSQMEQSDLYSCAGFCSWSFCVACENLIFSSFTCNAIFPSHSTNAEWKVKTPCCWGMGSIVHLSTFTDHRGSWCSIHCVFICSSVALKKKSSRGNLPALVLHTLMHDEAVEAAEDWENLTSALGSISFLLKSHSSVTWHPTWGFETSTWKSICAWGFFKINSKCFSLSDE